jgi:outer membrane protein assembly factor BamB
MKRLIAFVVLASCAAVGNGADNSSAWPRFRGPDGSGVAEGSKPPVEFGPDKNVKWKVAVPGGLSSPVVAGDKLVITAFDDGKLYTIAYDRESGKESWRAEAPAKEIEKYYSAEGSPAASTCATDGKKIVSYFGSCGLFCYDLSGKQLWNFELPTAVIPGNFGSGVSPILADGLVILVRDQVQDSKIIAIDADTGTVKWETKRQSPASYCSPVVWDTPEGKQVVAAGHARMTGYDFASGEVKWFVTGLPSACCASPISMNGELLFAGWSPGGADEKEFQMPTFDGLLQQLDSDKDGTLSRAESEKVFAGMFDSQDANQDNKISRDEWDTIVKFMSEGKNSAFALKPGGTGDVTKSHVLWKQTKGLPYVSSAIVYDGKFVMVKDGGIVTAYDPKTGAEKYSGRYAANGKYYASPVAANGHIYLISLDGVITVLDVTGTKPVAITHDVKLEERTAATPAIADGTLYVRTEKHLYAFAEK